MNRTYDFKCLQCLNDQTILGNNNILYLFSMQKFNFFGPSSLGTDLKDKKKSGNYLNNDKDLIQLKFIITVLVKSHVL